MFSIAKYLLGTWYTPGPVAGIGTLQRITHSQNAGAASVSLRGIQDGYSHNLCTGTEASRRGTNPRILGRMRRRVWEKPAAFRCLPALAFPFPPGPSCGLTPPVRAGQSICGMLIHARASEKGFGVWVGKGG